MFYIKSENIEELFREAAEKYQVDTADAEAWDDVRAAVHADDTPPPPILPPSEKKKRRRWFALLWLLLIPLGWFAHNVYTNMQAGDKQNNTDQAAKTELTAKQKTDNTATLQAEPNKTNGSLPTTVATAKGNDNTTGGTPSANADITSAGGTKGYAIMHVKQAGIAGGGVSANSGYTQQGASSALSNGKPVDGSNVSGGNTTSTTEGNSTNVLHSVNSGAPVTGTAQTAPLPVQETDKTNQPVINAAPEKNNTTAYNKKTAAKQKSPSDNSHYFYMGVSVAPDVSFIHLQKTSTLGTGIGVVVGYHLNKNISIESGALIEKKYYYTKGEYFNTSKIPYFVANNIQPTTATGNCNMIEIPLNVKYTFKASGKNNFYAIGGVSSYLMGHENYTFNYDDWGTPQQSTWGYNNKTNYFFSVLNLGAGYERKLGTKTNIRIEPYFKLPLTGFGTGSLKIASAGLYFTLTRKLF